jgi:hypothetical protein
MVLAARSACDHSVSRSRVDEHYLLVTMDDLRRPIGILFGTLGLIIALYGLLNPQVRAPLDPPINVNFWCGLTLVVFGGCLLWLSYRRRS